jgi:adenine/guanine phosphoribosyltransferase-like PRPP-binding protein
MAKVLPGRSAGPNDPIYSGGLEIFSPQEFKPSSTTSPTSTQITTAKSAVSNPNIRYSVRTSEGVNQPDVIIGSTLGAASNHPDYAAAKGGDLQAALRLAKTLVDADLVSRVRTLMGDMTPRIFPVVAVEASGYNKIPRAAAAVLAAQLGLCADVGMGQRNSPQRTGMDGIDRLFSSPVFEGEVIRGEHYILLDDTVTQGGTFAALASHIQACGGIVLGSVALTGKQYSAKIHQSTATSNQLREKFSDIESTFKAITGYGFDALTESEARYITSYKPADTIRVRVLAEGRHSGSAAAKPAPGEDLTE